MLTAPHLFSASRRYPSWHAPRLEGTAARCSAVRRVRRHRFIFATACVATSFMFSVAGSAQLARSGGIFAGTALLLLPLLPPPPLQLGFCSGQKQGRPVDASPPPLATPRRLRAQFLGCAARPSANVNVAWHLSAVSTSASLIAASINMTPDGSRSGAVKTQQSGGGSVWWARKKRHVQTKAHGCSKCFLIFFIFIFYDFLSVDSDSPFPLHPPPPVVLYTGLLPLDGDG